MKALIWNIRASQRKEVLDAFARWKDVDLLIVTEYTIPVAGDRLISHLAHLGWPYALSSAPGRRDRGVLIASKTPLSQPQPDHIEKLTELPRELHHRLAVTYLPDINLQLIGLYSPIYDGDEKESYWRALKDYAQADRHRRLLIAGDVNCCVWEDSESGKAYTPHALQGLRDVTIDAWMAMHPAGSEQPRDRYTWYSTNGLGIRLDCAFLSPALAPFLKATEHIHDVRTERISDYSALLVELCC